MAFPVSPFLAEPPWTLDKLCSGGVIVDSAAVRVTILMYFTADRLHSCSTAFALSHPELAVDMDQPHRSPSHHDHVALRQGAKRHTLGDESPAAGHELKALQTGCSSWSALRGMRGFTGSSVRRLIVPHL
jgi:hypothetical protein